MAIASAIVGGLIAGAGAVGAAAIGAKGASNAAKSSQQASEQATAFQRETRDMNMAALAPWQSSGLRANNQINALLGLGVAPTNNAAAMAIPQMGGIDWAGYVQGNPDALANWNAINGTSSGARFGGDMGAFGQFHYQDDGARRDLTPFQRAGGMTNGPTAQGAQSAAEDAFNMFRNSTGYQFRLNQGMNALNSGYAGRGAIKSGAAMKAINDYGQGMASQEFGNYMGLLQNQAGMGLSATNAQAGVASNAANNMGNIAMQNGANQANAALVRAQNTGQLVNSLATIGGGIAGQMGGGMMQPTMPVNSAGSQIIVTRGM